MQVIGVDIGNSAIKIGLQSSDGSLRRIRIAEISDSFELDLAENERFLWSICSVNPTREGKLIDWVKTYRPHDSIAVIEHNQISIVTNVKLRNQVGRDRLVAAWQAWESYQRELIVVDAGTAVTVDYVDSLGVFQGGVIFSGANACLNLLATAAENLPNLTSTDHDIDQIFSSRIGKDSESAILRGVFHAQLAAIKNIANAMQPGAKIIATGGEVERIAMHLPEEWEFDPMLVLNGTLSIGRAILTGNPQNQ